MCFLTLLKIFLVFATETATNKLPAPGILGLGPFANSNIVVSLFKTAYRASSLTPLDNIFRLNNKVGNYMTVLLGRVLDPQNNYPGDLTIMEILPGYENILKEPGLPVTKATHNDQHWSVLLDADGIIGPDGKTIALTTGVDSTPNKKQLTVMFDTGYALFWLQKC